MKKRRCYIYTRVSTSMQVEGYSLEAQKERLRKYADFQEMVIVGEYSDEGKSGKSIEGRQEFMQMLRDIEEGKDRVEFVLVYKYPVLEEMLQMYLILCRECRILE